MDGDSRCFLSGLLQFGQQLLNILDYVRSVLVVEFVFAGKGKGRQVKKCYFSILPLKNYLVLFNVIFK